MSRTARPKFNKDYYYHIVNRGNNKRNIFLSESDKLFFWKKFWDLIDNSDILLETFCIMNNHFHIELKPSSSDNVSKLMQRLCTSYARYYNRKYRNVGHVFQDRFKSKRIDTLQGVINVRKYIQNNPVKEGLADKPENYRWLWSRGTVPREDSPKSQPV